MNDVSLLKATLTPMMFHFEGRHPVPSSVGARVRPEGITTPRPTRTFHRTSHVTTGEPEIPSTSSEWDVNIPVPGSVVVANLLRFSSGDT